MKTISYKSIAIIFLSAMILSACSFSGFFDSIAAKFRGGNKSANQNLSMKEIVLQTAKDRIPLTVEVADNDASREQGLMRREKLEEGKGMWFVFQDEAPRQFWMKNTFIPLDILFFNSKKRIVHIVENMEPCKMPQCISYSSEDSAMFALEVRGGFVAAYKVKVGDAVISEK